MVNISNELVGQTTQRTVSRRAIEARQRGGLVVQEPLLESFEAEQIALAEFLVAAIQQYVSVPKAIRILGTMAVRAGDGSPEAQMMAQQDVATLAETLSRAFAVKFDVVPKSTPFEPSLRQQRWEVLLQLSERFGEYIPAAVLVDAAKDAGVLSEDQAQNITMHAAQVEQQKQLEQQAAQQGLENAAKPPEVAPPGPPQLRLAG